MILVVQRQLECHNIQVEVMDKNERVTKLIVAISSVKHIMINIEKVHAQVTVFTFKNLGSKTNDESSVILIRHGVESLPTDDSVS